jgi:hypothetical protein
MRRPRPPRGCRVIGKNKLCDKMHFCISVSVPTRRPTRSFASLSLITHQPQRPFTILNSFTKCTKCEITGSHRGAYEINLMTYDSVYTNINGATSQRHESSMHEVQFSHQLQTAYRRSRSSIQGYFKSEITERLDCALGTKARIGRGLLQTK